MTNDSKKQFDIVGRCFEFSKNVVLYLRGVNFSRLEFILANQVLRSTTSIGANVIEAKSGNSRKNMISYYSIALRSARETYHWLCLMRDTHILEKSEIEGFIKEADELSRIIAKSILTLKANSITNNL